MPDPFASVLSGGLGDVSGGVISAGVGLYEQRRNEAFQREMAQNGIRWRVNDAEAAGVSPLFALGAAGASGSSPSFITGDLGQNVSRAALSGASDQERADALGRNKLVEAQLKETDLRSEGIRLQNAKLAQELYGSPGIPSLFSSGGSGGGGSRGKGLVVHEPDQFGSGLRGAVTPESVKVPSASEGSRAVVAGETPMWQSFRMTDGTVVKLPYVGEGQTFMGQAPYAGMALSFPQWLYEQTLNLGEGVSRRGRADAAKFVPWWNRNFVHKIGGG